MEPLEYPKLSRSKLTRVKLCFSVAILDSYNSGPICACNGQDCMLLFNPADVMMLGSRHSP